MKKQMIPCILLVVLAGCTAESEMGERTNEISRVTITAKDFDPGDAVTRTVLSASENGLAFTWAATDVVGIYPNAGSQVDFPMTEGAGTNTATFDGGGWALRGNYTYAAYSPYDVANTVNRTPYTAIPLTWNGQSQLANNSTADMGAYDYLVATTSTPASGIVTFNFEHVGAVLNVCLNVPETDKFTRLAISTEEDLWVTDATVNISTGELTPVKNAREISVGLGNIMVEAGGTLSVYLMVAPQDLTGKTIKINTEGNNTYTARIDGKNFQPGKAYKLTAITEQHEASPLIFKEIFTAGGKAGYTQDSYFEIVNNSDEVQYLDQLVLLYATSAQKGPNAWQANGVTDIYYQSEGPVVAFRGNGKDYPIQPGASVVIANDATNHQTADPDGIHSDLSNADWEIYLDYSRMDDIDYDAPNLIPIFYNNVYMRVFALGYYNGAYVLAKLPISPTRYAANDNNSVW